jgi:predicted small secreted protein
MLRLILILTATLGLTACETVEGFGRDVSAAGDQIEDASEETQQQM